jgi:hypothetical protein
MTSDDIAKDQVRGIVYAFNCLTTYLRYTVDSVAPGDIHKADTQKFVTEVMSLYRSIDELAPRLQELATIYNIGAVPGPPVLCCPIDNAATSDSIKVVDHKVRMRMVYEYNASLDTLWDMVHLELKAKKILGEDRWAKIREYIWDMDYGIDKIRTLMGL